MRIDEFANGVMTVNLATLVRVLRRGPVDLRSRLKAAFEAIDPFDSGSAKSLPARLLSSISPQIENSCGTVDKVSQLMLLFKYQDILRQNLLLPNLNEVEFKNFSQNREDGILLFLFAILGTTNKRCVEMCAGDGIECNTSNLVINHNWDALMFDGSAANVAKGRAFYSSRKDGLQWRTPKIVQSWLTAENINNLIRDNGFEGEIDLLSLDMDGIDYWVWDALECIQPRVVVLEYNQGLGSTRAVTIRNNPDFVLDWSRDPYYHGASLPAFIKLGRKKGYRLVGTEKTGVNAFFVRSDLAETSLPEVPISKCSVWGVSESVWLENHDWVEV